MPGDETRQKTHDESDSESEDEDAGAPEAVAQVDIDPSKLTPLSPEVISKQVCVCFCVIVGVGVVCADEVGRLRSI